jgi:hypothetical protein
MVVAGAPRRGLSALRTLIKEIPLLHRDEGGSSRYHPVCRRRMADLQAMRAAPEGGAEGTRTPYLFNAIEALSQMSYSPTAADHSVLALTGAPGDG